MTLWQRMRALMGWPQRGQEREAPMQPPGYPRRREDAPPPPIFPPPYPGPDVLGRIEEQRKPINYLNLHLPDGSTVPIIPLLRLPLLTPGTWTNDDPGAGSVSWAGCQLAHEGEMFEIDDGNTALAYIYWDKSVSQTAFQTSAGKPTLDPTEDLLICFNDAGTAKLAFLSDLIQAGYIVCQQLDVLSANMGILTAGEIQLGSGTPGVDFTGIWIYKSGATYRVSGWLSNVLQAYLDSDGKLRAGGGDVTLDVDGITIKSASAKVADRSIKFDTAGTTQAEFYSLDEAQTGDGKLHIEFDPAATTEIWKDGVGNISLKDPNAGTKTLSDLAPDVGFFGFGGYNNQTIAAGKITAVKTYIRIDTEDGDAADDLDTIDGGVIGDLVIFRINNNARGVTIKDATGNLLLDGSVDFVMNSTQDTIMLMRGSGGPTGGYWMELSRSSPD